MSRTEMTRINKRRIVMATISRRSSTQDSGAITPIVRIVEVIQGYSQRMFFVPEAITPRATCSKLKSWRRELVLTELRWNLASVEASPVYGECGSPCVASLSCSRPIPIVPLYLLSYPFLESEDLQEALRYAAATVDDEDLIINRLA